MDRFLVLDVKLDPDVNLAILWIYPQPVLGRLVGDL
jgi:hypothetical protein